MENQSHKGLKKKNFRGEVKYCLLHMSSKHGLHYVQISNKALLCITLNTAEIYCAITENYIHIYSCYQLKRALFFLIYT